MIFNYVYFIGSQDAAHDFGTLRKYKVMCLTSFSIICVYYYFYTILL